MSESKSSRPLAATFGAEDLAVRAGTSVRRVAELSNRGLLPPSSEGRYTIGDVHRIRAIEAFAAAGVPLEALARAEQAGTISLAYYDRLHAVPGTPASRTYAELRESLGSESSRLAPLFAAFGLAEPEPGSRLSADEEAFVAEFVRLVGATGHPDLAIRVARVFGDATQRAAEASLGIYSEVVERVAPELGGLPPQEQFEREFAPWAELARRVPAMASWLASRHMSRAIDAYSVVATEEVLEASGYVPRRAKRPPAVAFVDLTGFTRLAQEQGDEAAAALALRLGELASATVQPHGGRVVKLLGDGVLLRFSNAKAAVGATLALLMALPEAGLPPGHAGVHAGPVIARDGDVYGRTVNLAARIGDAADAGELLVSEAVLEQLEDVAVAEPVGTRELQGIGAIPLFRVRQRS